LFERDKCSSQRKCDGANPSGGSANQFFVHCQQMLTVVFDDFKSKDGGQRTEIVPHQVLL